MKYTFPTLYKRDATYKIREWTICVDEIKKNGYIYTKYGVKGGKIIHSEPKIIDKPVGKKSAYERALNIAKTQWKNRQRKGYTTNIKNINKNIPTTNTNHKNLSNKNNIKNNIKNKTNIKNNVKNKNNIKNVRGPVPMRAQKLTNKKVHFPAYVQPKIDGYRALLHYDKQLNRYIFTSNSGRIYPHLEHFDKDLKKIKELKNNPDFYLDGELYLEKHHINVLRSILSTQKLDEKQRKICLKIKFYIFDVFDLKKMYLDYEPRFGIICDIFKKKYDRLYMVPTTEVNNFDDLDKAFTKYVDKGYEGIIIRNKSGIYRLGVVSKDILKSKNISSSVFVIVGYKEGKGSDKGTVIWDIRCKKNSRKSFWAKPMGTREFRRELFKNGEKYIGKEIMVKYFEIDSQGCVTKNPVAYFTPKQLL